MTGKEEYERAKQLVATYHGNATAMADAIRSEIAATRLAERAQWSKMLKGWATMLQESGEPYLANCFTEASDSVRNGLYAVPGTLPGSANHEALIAELEEDL